MAHRRGTSSPRFRRNPRASGTARRRPELWNDIIFAWKTAAITKSNAIVLVKDGAAVGIGGGFTNRVDAAEYAIKMAKDKAQGSVMASDAFFPFADSIELAARAGVSAVIEPGRLDTRRRSLQKSRRARRQPLRRRQPHLPPLTAKGVKIMKVMVLGGGGREHAVVHALSKIQG